MTTTTITTRHLGKGDCDWTGDRRWKSGELRPRMEGIYPVEMTADRLAEAKARSNGDAEVFMICRLMDLQGGELVHGMWPVSYHATEASARVELAREGARNMISVLVCRDVDADGRLADSWFTVDHSDRFVALDDELHPAIQWADERGWGNQRWAS